MHFAAETHVDRSLVSAAHFIRTNIEGTRAVIEAAYQHKTPRFIYISTDEVYGSIPRGYASEDAPLRPSNPYASSKAGGDLLVQSYMKAYKIPAIIVRGSNNYGAFQYPEKLIPLAISNMMEGKKIPIHGDGTHVRSWLHVEDFARAIDIIAHRAADHTVYNVAGEQKSNLDILALLAHQMEKDLSAHREHVADRPGADLRYAPSAKKIERELHWAREHNLAASIAGVVDWYRKNEAWWRPIKQTSEFQDYYCKQAAAQWC